MYSHIAVMHIALQIACYAYVCTVNVVNTVDLIELQGSIETYVEMYPKVV